MSSDVPEHPVPELASADIVALATVARVGPSTGFDVKCGIEDALDERDRAHSQLYPRLDRLAELGLIDKSETDGLGNEYRITEAGEETLRDAALWIVDTAGL